VTKSSRRRRFALAGLAVTLLGFVVAGLVAPGAASAASARFGYVRLAHLSPDTPDVDVYLDSASSQIKEQVFKGVGYGVMSDYLKLPAGEYAVSMRLAGAAPSTPPVLTTDVDVQSGDAYTVAGVGPRVGLGLKVFHDNLSSPGSGKAKVRIIQASIKEPSLNVSLTDGEKIANGVAFATTTSYQRVKSGNFSIVVSQSGGGKTTRLHVDLRSNSVYSLLVLDGKSGLKPDLRLDAAGATSAPSHGGVPAGLGGTSPRQIPILAVSVLALAGIGFGGIAFVTRRRSNALVKPGAGEADRRVMSDSAR